MSPPDGSATPCRLFVYLAHDAPIGVVLRRGPSDWARLSLWHTASDRIEHGPWIKGRIYERRSDVSPDGRLFAAFVRQSGGGRPGQPPAGADTWVTISRPPYFTALALWSIGGTYYTGAFFPRPRTLWLGFMEPQAPDIGSTPPWLDIARPREIPYVDGTANWTDRTVHFNRLLRDGWELLASGNETTTWRRPHPHEPLTLTMVHTFDDFRNAGGPYVVKYAVRDDGGRDHALGRASWADWDQQGRLVLAREGRLLTWTAEAGFTTIADLNGQEPDPQPAPAWATEWF